MALITSGGCRSIRMCAGFCVRACRESTTSIGFPMLMLALLYLSFAGLTVAVARFGSSSKDSESGSESGSESVARFGTAFASCAHHCTRG